MQHWPKLNQRKVSQNVGAPLWEWLLELGVGSKKRAGMNQETGKLLLYRRVTKTGRENQVDNRELAGRW